MKKIIWATFLLTSSLISSASATVLKIADTGDMPQGLYSRASGYLEGDLITLKNGSTGESIQLLNLGDSGLADTLIISNEAAVKLNLEDINSLELNLPARIDSKTSVITQVLLTNPSDETYFENLKSSVEEKSPLEKKYPSYIYRILRKDIL